MYWQVYLHKTVLCAEKMLVKIIERAADIKAQSPSPVLNIFLNREYDSKRIENHLDEFCRLDDYDIMFSIKSWINHPDKILSLLCKSVVNRHLLKIVYSDQEIPEELLNQKKDLVTAKLKIKKEESDYLVFTGEVENKTYNNKTEHIHILFKDDRVKDISEVDNALINQSLFGSVKKFYICFINTDITL
jgi:HD superfamily phosphohydrolase